LQTKGPLEIFIFKDAFRFSFYFQLTIFLLSFICKKENLCLFLSCLKRLPQDAAQTPRKYETSGIRTPRPAPL